MKKKIKKNRQNDGLCFVPKPDDKEFDEIKTNLAHYIMKLQSRVELDNFLFTLATKYRGMRTKQAVMRLIGLK